MNLTFLVITHLPTISTFKCGFVSVLLLHEEMLAIVSSQTFLDTVLYGWAFYLRMNLVQTKKNVAYRSY